MSSRSCWFARYAICVRPFFETLERKGYCKHGKPRVNSRRKPRTRPRANSRLMLVAGQVDPADLMTCRTRPDGYFRLVAPTPGCRLPTLFWLGAAAIVLIFSFFGFFVSRLLRCSPLAMAVSPWV